MNNLGDVHRRWLEALAQAQHQAVMLAARRSLEVALAIGEKLQGLTEGRVA